MAGEGHWWLQTSKHHVRLQEGSIELQASHSYFCLWKNYVANPGRNVWTQEGLEGRCEQPVWIYERQITLTNLIAYSDKMTVSVD